MKIRIYLFMCFTLASCAVVESKNQPVRVYVEKGHCPFECCTYREWVAKTETDLLSEPKVGADIISTVKAAEKANALTGETRAIPVRFLITQDFFDYKKGDELWVYAYYGEVFFKVWHDGKEYITDLRFSPYGGSSGKRCTLDEDYCFGQLEKEFEFTWWVKMRDAQGHTGWTNQPENFGNKDSCG